MFRNRALKVTMIKELDNVPETTCNHLDPEQIGKIAKDVVVTVGSVIVAVKLLDTISQIVVITAKAKIR